MNWRVWLLVGIVTAITAGIFLFPPIPQDESYHHFADLRTLAGMPNTLDTLSNAFFLIAGVLGLRFLLRAAQNAVTPGFLNPRERWPYFIFFIGVSLTAFGSAYYHAHPDDARLVWDRLPMTLGFMALLAAMLNERVGVRVGTAALAPLLVFGVGSVVYWSITQHSGHGDLRPYVLAQFSTLAILLLLISLFPPRYTRGLDLLISLGIYGLAKVLELLDRPIYEATKVVSGHTLKHIAAALSAYWILRMLELRHPMVSARK